MISVPKHIDRFWLPGSVVLLGAFALRVYALGGQSLWNDEGTSIALSARSLGAIADGAAKDIHPPLYYFLLHFWMPLAGESEFGVRFLSVAAGVLLVAFAVRLTRDLFGNEAALVAGLLSALSPFQIYYSQETRMYIWVALWSAVSVWAMVKWRLKNGDWRLEFGDWLLYVGATVAALYTHYFAPAVVVAENLAFGVWLALTWRGGQSPTAVGGPRSAVLSQRSAVGRTLVLWIAAQLLIGLAFLPWYVYAGNQLAAWPSVSEPFDLPTLLWRVLNVFSSGLSLDGPAATITALILGALALFGLLPAHNRQPTSPPSPLLKERGDTLPFPKGKGAPTELALGVRSLGASSDSALAGWASLLLGLWLLVPVGVMYVISLSRPAYNPKFLLLATPPFLILAARGLSNLRVQITLFGPRGGQTWQAFYSILGVAILAVVGFLPSLRYYYSDPRYARDDYRAILQYVDTNAQPGDGILVDAPGQADVVRYYHRGDQPLFLLPIGRPLDLTATQANLDEMLGRVQRVYAIYWATEQADPERIVESRLAEQAFKARDEWHGNVRLAIYGIAPPARLAAQMVDAEFGGEIRLTGYQLDTEKARAGGMLTLTLHWQAEQIPSARYKVFVHLLDAENHVVAQRDGEPVGDLRLTTTWRAGELIADNYGILIEPETPLGEYRIEVGMYRADSGIRLPIVGRDGPVTGDSLILDSVRITE